MNIYSDIILLHRQYESISLHIPCYTYYLQLHCVYLFIEQNKLLGSKQAIHIDKI